jgi:hypothetical protein
MLNVVFCLVNIAGYLVLRLFSHVTFQCTHVAAGPRTREMYLLLALAVCLVSTTGTGDDGRVEGACCLHIPVTDD